MERASVFHRGHARIPSLSDGTRGCRKVEREPVRLARIPPFLLQPPLAPDGLVSIKVGNRAIEFRNLNLQRLMAAMFIRRSSGF